MHSAAGVPTQPDASAPARPRLWTREFFLVCFATLFCYSSHMLLAPILPLYVAELGGSTVAAGFVFTAFSVTSFFLRPLIGHLTDAWSVRGVLSLGSAILGLLSLALFVPSLAAAFVSNAIRGIGWGAINTAGSTAVAVTTPPSRRGEASGYYSVATTTANGVAPALALWLLSSSGSFNGVILAAGVSGLLAAASLRWMPAVGEGGQGLRRALRWKGGGLSPDAFVDRGVLLASLLLICVSATTPVMVAFVPLHALSIDVQNIGLYFIAGSVTSVVARLVIGPSLDRGSRGLWIVLGYATIILSFAVLMVASSIELFVLASVINAVGQSVAQPSLMAVAIDRAERSRMGKAMATFSMFYRAGEAIGAPIAGALIALFGYSGMYLGAIASVALGIAFTGVNWPILGQPIQHRPET